MRPALPLALLLVLGLSDAALGRGEAVSGFARAVDGDTLDVGGVRVRLHGVDAPESAQACTDARGRSYPCGRAAARRLAELVRLRPVTCASRGADDYGRVLGACTAGGRDLAGLLVREGHAWAFTRFSNAYAPEEREARAARRGVFAGENAPPWEYRSRRWEGGTASVGGPGSAQGAPAGCPIKGNVSGEQRIYHLPWQRDYERVRIDPRRGERWFCDEAQAERAGFRRAAR
jgi:endonuclease YncB( thermonuclease family)